MMTRCLTLLLLLGGLPAFADEPDSQGSPASTPMTSEALDLIIEGLANDVHRGPGLWTFDYGEVQLTCLISTEYDRMRVVAPITLASQITSEQRDRMLAANYDTALDARYSMNEGVVYSTYIHPLSPLTKAQFVSALDQVASLVRTFGTTYSSGELKFRDPEDQNTELST